MAEHDWSTFTIKTYINTSPKQVYNAWLTQEGMEKWFLKTCIYQNRERTELAQSGDKYRWTWYTKDNYTDTGKIIDVQSPNYLKFTFGPAICSVSITNESEGTLLKLIQENIPTDEISKVMWNTSCQVGWTYFFMVLKAYLEHGIDLREKEPNRLEDCSKYKEELNR